MESKDELTFEDETVYMLHLELNNDKIIKDFDVLNDDEIGGIVPLLKSVGGRILNAHNASFVHSYATCIDVYWNSKKHPLLPYKDIKSKIKQNQILDNIASSIAAISGPSLIAVIQETYPLLWETPKTMGYEKYGLKQLVHAIRESRVYFVAHWTKFKNVKTAYKHWVNTAFVISPNRLWNRMSRQLGARLPQVGEIQMVTDKKERAQWNEFHAQYKEVHHLDKKFEFVRWVAREKKISRLLNGWERFGFVTKRVITELPSKTKASPSITSKKRKRDDQGNALRCIGHETHIGINRNESKFNIKDLFASYW